GDCYWQSIVNQLCQCLWRFLVWRITQGWFQRRFCGLL
ncbi:hypothetical protein, partial [uncultured Gammaproteobacteria bacterium]